MLISILLIVGGVAAMYVDWHRMGGLGFLGFLCACCGLVHAGEWWARRCR